VIHPNGHYGDDLLGKLTPAHLLALYLPPLLVVCWGAAQTLRAAKAWDRGKLA
jgi:hypothetical protein